MLMAAEQRVQSVNELLLAEMKMKELSCNSYSYPQNQVPLL
jgi:hypothetical protein